jgi:hypothetical protein
MRMAVLKKVTLGRGIAARLMAIGLDEKAGPPSLRFSLALTALRAQTLAYSGAE